MSALHEECAVVGIEGAIDAASLNVLALRILQHRGQEAAGGATYDDNGKLHIHKDSGLVVQVFDSDVPVPDVLPGKRAIGHTRYSTFGGASKKHAQPAVTGDGKELVVGAHNGNLSVIDRLRNFLETHQIRTSGRNDSEMMVDAIGYYMAHGASLEDAISESFPLFTGAFSFIAMTKDKVAAVRDASGIRPLSVGRRNGAYLFTSETCALDKLGATYQYDVRPGELIVAGPDGLASHELAKGENKLDVCEFLYFARPDSMLLGKQVSEVRRALGAELAKEFSVPADVVIPVPDSAVPLAEGYAEASGLPFRTGIIKDRYIYRTFITPDPQLRGIDADLKYNPVREAVAGKRVIVLDDTIYRQTTAERIVAKLLQAGAAEVHFLVGSPPMRYPDFYGMDVPDQLQLVAARYSVDQIRQHIRANSLHYLSYAGMIRAIGLPETSLCTSAFTGEYPIDIGHHGDNIIFDNSWVERH